MPRIGFVDGRRSGFGGRRRLSGPAGPSPSSGVVGHGSTPFLLAEMGVWKGVSRFMDNRGPSGMVDPRVGEQRVRAAQTVDRDSFYR
jgi:hypothetical protein